MFRKSCWSPCSKICCSLCCFYERSKLFFFSFHLSAKSYLHELGIFKDVSVYIDVSRGENASPNGYEITFKGKELSRIVGSVGTEVGQNEGSLRTELTIPNLFGRGESISLQGSYSSKRANDIQLKFWKSYFHTKLVENRPE